MSKTLILTGKSSEIVVDYFPPIELAEDGIWEIGMLNFETYHSLSNISGDEPIVDIYEESVPVGLSNTEIKIPSGFFEIEELQKAINEKIHPEKIEITVDESSLRCRLKSSVHMHLRKQMKKILGFEISRIEKDIVYVSENSVDINSINVININCSIATGSYVNENKSHIIHSFFPSVPHGYKIIEVPSNVIYHQLTSNVINSLVVRIEDQEGNLINFGKETITVRLHLRKRPHDYI